MSDVEIILSAFPRIYFACRPRQVTDPVDGKVLSFHQATILSHLDLVDPTMVGELAGHLGVTASTMSLNLSRLEEGGYVTRQRDPEDRRVMNVCLTEAGERVRLAHNTLDPDRVDRMIDGLDPVRRRTALSGLAYLAEAADGLVRRGQEHVSGLTS
ncbi:MAG TPA: MarR family transcriptional regulator [Gemmatimonadetes bacterium]|jgi:DNA-binding MarR family transcriptional regulator|nr:MarR family transcriptional regulator [Gemmatimonadota bacterium]